MASEVDVMSQVFVRPYRDRHGLRDSLLPWLKRKSSAKSDRDRSSSLSSISPSIFGSQSGNDLAVVHDTVEGQPNIVGPRWRTRQDPSDPRRQDARHSAPYIDFSAGSVGVCRQPLGLAFNASVEETIGDAVVLPEDVEVVLPQKKRNASSLISFPRIGKSLPAMHPYVVKEGFDSSSAELWNSLPAMATRSVPNWMRSQQAGSKSVLNPANQQSTRASVQSVSLVKSSAAGPREADFFTLKRNEPFGPASRIRTRVASSGTVVRREPSSYNEPAQVRSFLVDLCRKHAAFRWLLQLTDNAVAACPNIQGMITFVEVLLVFWVLYELSVLIRAISVAVRAICLPLIIIGRLFHVF